jgi:hypothetical protein
MADLFDEHPDDPRLDPWRRDYERMQRGDPAPNHVDPPKLHHHVPEMYLKRFGKLSDDGRRRRNPKERIMRIEPNLGPVPLNLSIREAATESGLYTAVREDPRDEEEVEHLLGIIESCAGGVFKRLDADPSYFPDEVDRFLLANFMALQSIRGPQTRETHTEQQTQRLREAMRRSAEDREYVRRSLSAEGLVASDVAVDERIADVHEVAEVIELAPNNNEVVVEILQGSMRRTPYLFERVWTLHRTARPLLTTDQPLVALSPTMEPLPGNVLRDAPIISFPLDRWRLVLMHRRDSRILDGNEDEIEGQHVRNFNVHRANRARRWVFHHPDDRPLDGVPFREPRP